MKDALLNGQNGEKPKTSTFKIEDRFYGKEFIKLVQVERNGAMHTVKEYHMELKMSLAGVKEYMTTDISDLVCADGCKDTLYILANNHGIKSPEAFGILACNHFLATYRNMTKVSLSIDDFSWNRISSEDEKASTDAEAKLHHHAFIHHPDCIRTCSVTLSREDIKPRVESGVKRMRLIKSDQATLVGFHRDAYRTLQDLHERVLSTDVTCTWRYKTDTTDIDYDALWNRAKNCIIECWGGDYVKGVLSPCMQYTLQTAETKILESIPEIVSVDAMFPNLLYAEFDFSKFNGLTTISGSRKIYVPVQQPASLVAAVMVRQDAENIAAGIHTNGV